MADFDDITNIDIDKLIDEYDFASVDETEYDIGIEDNNLELSASQKFYKIYDRYQSIFGDTFDSYLVMKGDDEVVERAIAAMEDAIKNGNPVTTSDLGLPEAEAPKDEFDAPDLL